MKIEKQRISYIDSLKGLGIILIVVGHIIPYESMLHVWIYSFHVPIFFIISGMLFKMKQEEICEEDFNIIVKKKVKN